MRQWAARARRWLLGEPEPGTLGADIGSCEILDRVFTHEGYFVPLALHLGVRPPTPDAVDAFVTAFVFRELQGRKPSKATADLFRAQAIAWVRSEAGAPGLALVQ